MKECHIHHSLRPSDKDVCVFHMGRGLVGLCCASLPRHLSILPFLDFGVGSSLIRFRKPANKVLLRLLSPGQNIISASSLSKSINPQLEKCPSDTYVIVSQPKVNAADYAISSATPHLRAMMRGDEQTIRSSHTVRDVYGTLDAQAMSKTVEEKCNAGHLKIDASSEISTAYDLFSSQS